MDRKNGEDEDDVGNESAFLEPDDQIQDNKMCSPSRSRSPRRFFCLSSVEGEIMDKKTERKDSDWAKHIWLLFQDAATNTSKLYQARSAGRDGHWHNFQNAATAISLLYKESVDTQQRSFDAGYRAGVEKAYNELMEWLVKEPRYRSGSRKHIRTDDLINFVYSPINPATFSAKLRPERSHTGLDSLLTADVADLQTFRDALHLQSLNGAMAHVSVNHRSGSGAGSNSATPTRTSTSPSRSLDLHAFVTEEMRRHKRSTSLAFGLDLDLDPDHMNEHIPFKRARKSPPHESPRL